MTLGFIGLGKMGQSIVLHLLEQGTDVVVYNRTKETTDTFRTQNTELNDQLRQKLHVAYSIAEFIKNLPAPRVIWIMVAAGAPVDEVIGQLLEAGVTKGDILIDGGNSFYKDSVRRSKDLQEKGIHYIDCGTSGGLEGARTGACLMIGGEETAVGQLNWVWNQIAVKDGWSHFGPSGAGHFVKMVHNGVEYGMNQAIGEGFEILAKAPYQLDLAKVASNWNHGSVVRSWLVELLARALSKDPKLEQLAGVVGGGETGRWTIETAGELDVDVQVLKDSLTAREKSQTKPTFATKVVSALRKEYGGHGEGAKK